MPRESTPEVTLPADCTPFTPWVPWTEDGVPDGQQFRGVYGREFGDRFIITTSALQFSDGSMSHATLDIGSRHHRSVPGSIDAPEATQLAANLLEAANELDRLNRWTGE